MTHDITDYNETTFAEQHNEDTSAPPLCLVHYFAERAAYPPERSPKPPGSRVVGRVAERRGNLIVLEFTAAETARAQRPDRRSRWARVYDALMILLLLACLLGCLAAFRF